MNLFDNINDRNIFIDPIVLDFEYLPKLLPFRESEQHHIADCIKPLFNNSLGKNILVIGKPGIGKSAACKFVLRELEEKGLDEKIIPLYINCWKNNTEHQFLLEICNQIDYKFTQNKTSLDLLKTISKILNKKAVVICLDEVDKLADYSIIYNLIEDIFKKTLILITNKTSFLAELDKRIHSRLTPEIINFKHYNYEETKEILKQRMDLAFNKNTFEQEAFEEISAKSAYEKDIRLGLTLLKESAATAELKNNSVVKKEHVIEAINKLFPEEEITKEIENKIISLLKEKKQLTTKEILNELNDKKINYRQLTVIISKMKDKKLITTNIIAKGKYGNIPVHSLVSTVL